MLLCLNKFQNVSTALWFSVIYFSSKKKAHFLIKKIDGLYRTWAVLAANFVSSTI